MSLLERFIRYCQIDTQANEASHTVPTPGIPALYEFGHSAALVPVHDGWSWDAHRPDWAYDHQI